MDHTTTHRWTVRYAPLLLERFNRRKRSVTGRWHIDETYIKVRGQWMYPPHAATLMAGLIRSGLVDLDHFEITAFGLDRANEAVAHAAAHSGPFRMTVIQPR